MASEEAITQAFDEAIDWVFKSSDLVSEYFEGDEKNQILSELGKTVEELCATDKQFKVSCKCLSKLEETEGHCTYNELKTALKESLEKNREKGKLDFKKHERHIEWKEKLNAVITESAEDEDLVCTEADINIIDPYTKALIQNPIKNKLCGHHYEKTSILSLLQAQKKAIVCPYSGCRSRKFTEADLIEDRQLTRKVQQKVQQKSSQAATSSNVSALNITE